ncbi:MAG: MAE_28990/MAE_18760 family HEPN-like nuclease [Rhodobacteraceae bacterium]|nr:MAE_28990/MAE_18760 family HEPN-like nuclease [Paracoccaceae bacterium]MCY4197132.1 MAE_28990/MAE_18760 family HEPN-like nuclease [Paracoccaceae bacterium]MCY4328118.1 MAE_28990/MAE_18760 family HEPN-like nuclease [Paracoccaceae bacterium]
MIEVLNYLDDREEEFERHMSIARMLEARVDEIVEEGGARVEVRHINTLKSGLLIHLYNIVEATMTKTLETVGQTVVKESPNRWTRKVLEEWVRSEVWGSEERIGEGALKRLVKVSGTLASGKNLTKFVVKGVSGSWDDKSVKKVAQSLGCKLNLTRKVRRDAYEKIYRNETTAMEYVAERRNAIAHGGSTFEDAANDLTLDKLDEVAKRVLPYLREVSKSYQVFLDNKCYVVEKKVGI